MKCMICGGQTLPGAKLCLPCRSALRRARDDTISELLPLPRRREGFAYQHVATVSGVFPQGRRPVEAATAKRERASAARKSSRRLTPTHFRTAAIALFTIAAGILAVTALSQMQRDRAHRAETAARSADAETRGTEPRVSPATLLGAARSETDTPARGEPVAEEVSVAEPAPVATASDPRKVAKPKAAAARPVMTVDAPASVEPPLVVVAAPEPLPGPPARVAADPAQLLSAAITVCGGDFFARVGCEQRARTQYCDGRWGRDAQCPAGISNDHGQ